MQHKKDDLVYSDSKNQQKINNPFKQEMNNIERTNENMSINNNCLVNDQSNKKEEENRLSSYYKNV